MVFCGIVSCIIVISCVVWCCWYIMLSWVQCTLVCGVMKCGAVALCGVVVSRSVVEGISLAGVAGVVLMWFCCGVGLVSYREIAMVLYHVVSWNGQCFFSVTHFWVLVKLLKKCSLCP